MNSRNSGSSLRDLYSQTREKCHRHIYDHNWIKTARDNFLTIHVHSTLKTNLPMLVPMKNPSLSYITIILFIIIIIKKKTEWLNRKCK